MLKTQSAVPVQVEVQLLTDPWQSLEHATPAQLADPKLEAAVKVAVNKLHAINKYRHGDIRKPNLIFRYGVHGTAFIFLVTDRQCFCSPLHSCIEVASCAM